MTSGAAIKVAFYVLLPRNDMGHLLLLSCCSTRWQMASLNWSDYDLICLNVRVEKSADADTQRQSALIKNVASVNYIVHTNAFLSRAKRATKKIISVFKSHRLWKGSVLCISIVHKWKLRSLRSKDTKMLYRQSSLRSQNNVMKHETFCGDLFTCPKPRLQA